MSKPLQVSVSTNTRLIEMISTNRIGILITTKPYTIDLLSLNRNKRGLMSFKGLGGVLYYKVTKVILLGD